MLHDQRGAVGTVVYAPTQSEGLAREEDLHAWPSVVVAPERPCARELFAERFGHEMPTDLTHEVLAFREAGLVDFVGAFRRAGRFARRGAAAAVRLLLPTGGVHGISS